MELLSYRPVIEGDNHFAGAFKGMALKREAGTTIRTDPVGDQADLHGLLERVAGLGLTLLSPRGLGAMTVDLTTSHTLRQGSSNDARS